MPDAALSLTDVSVSLAGQDTLRNLSFTVWPGECVAVFGAVGAGKTALLRAASGKLRPTSGLLVRAGSTVLITGEGGSYWRKAGRYAGTEALDQDGLLDLASRRLSSLSRTERQAVELVRAMAAAPGLVLLDDPSPDLVARARGGSAAVLFTTRHAPLALQADRILVLDGGMLLRDGAASEVYDRPGTMRVARMFGPANALSGTVREARPGGFYWAMAGLRHFQADGPGTTQPAPGSPVLLCLRPERLYPVAPDADGDNILDAEVLGLRRDGPWLLVDLATPMGAMKARLDLAWAGLHPRYKLRVAWDAAAPVLVAAGGTAVA